MSTYYLKQTRSRPVPGAAITDQAGIWTDVTPYSAGVTLAPNGTHAGPGQNFGSQGVWADPVVPGKVWSSFCFQGLFVSTDSGRAGSWSRVVPSSGLDPIYNSRAYLGFAPDGSYICASALFSGGLGGVNNGYWKSTNGGLTWTRFNVGSTLDDMMGFWPFYGDALRIVGSAHTDSNHLYESIDAGATWVDQGAIGNIAGDEVDIPHFTWVDSDTLIALSDGDANPTGPGTWRGVRSGSVWPWTWTWTSVVLQQHWHGGSQSWRNPANGDIYLPGAFGIYRSQNGGVSWTRITTDESGGIVYSGTALYMTKNYATQGSFGPGLELSTLAAPTIWTPSSTPAGMTNGWLNAAVTINAAARPTLVTGNWNAGNWRYVE